jgi:hypothetical protein
LHVIVQLPFQVPDPVGEWERTLYADLVEYKDGVVAPEMLIKLKQGFVRLIRTERDTGAVAILDSRVNKGKAYRFDEKRYNISTGRLSSHRSSARSATGRSRRGCTECAGNPENTQNDFKSGACHVILLAAPFLLC